MNITVKRASECSLEQLTAVWNEGFSDYYSKITFSVEMFTNRFAFDELMPSRSVVAFMDDRPVGIVLNGIRTVNGKKVAWNGGTSVAPAYRRCGVGKAMIDASLAIYHEEGVELATLEAYKQNDRAISLYEQKGYQVVDHLELYELKDAMNPVQYNNNDRYYFKRGLPLDASKLPFYQYDLPWQSHWSNLRTGGQSIIIMEDDQAVGYILYKQIYDETGKLKDVLMYQCQVDPRREDREAIARFGMSKLYAADQLIPRCASFNTPVSQQWLTEILRSSGFSVVVEQVYMTYELNK